MDHFERVNLWLIFIMGVFNLRISSESVGWKKLLKDERSQKAGKLVKPFAVKRTVIGFQKRFLSRKPDEIYIKEARKPSKINGFGKLTIY